MIHADLGLIFDMDGVIVHSNPVHREAWSRYNRQFGIETGEEMHRRMYGKRNDEIVRDFFGADLPETEVAARGAAKEALYRRLMAPRLEESLVPGVREFLDRSAGLPVGLATNAEPANVDFVLDGAGLRPFFRAVANGQEVSRPKPDPEIYLRVAALLGLDPRNCIVFEDSYSGVAAARAAGARVVALRTTHTEFDGVDLAVSDFRCGELQSWLRRQQPLV
ncbi:MAG: HAD-IA family hydrolase [Bryobacterales bacterium]|nr:HAD-IA family hydrolase [Bryobacterales bacterium]